MSVAAIAGRRASPAIVNSSSWNRGRVGRLSQLAAVRLASARSGVLIITGQHA
jgi:hypothetical protein